MLTKLFFLALAGAVLLTALPLSAGGKVEYKSGFIDFLYKGKHGDGKYVVYVPEGYTGEKVVPTILFLHGAGETGTDGKEQVRVGLGKAIKDTLAKKKDFPFLVVFPQSQKRTWQAGSEDANRALAILHEVKKEFKVDPQHMYLTGLSMGGYGTWSLAAAYPEMWAAIVPICGGGNVKDAEKLKNLPIWNFHGDDDKAVPVQRSRDMIKALKDAGGSPRYDEYPGVGHNSWDRAYATPELYPWMLSQKRK